MSSAAGLLAADPSEASRLTADDGRSGGVSPSGHQRSNSIAVDYSNEQYVNDVTIEWLYKPHSLLALALCACVLMFAAFGSGTTTFRDSLVNGLSAAAFIFLVLGLLIFPSGPFIRPNPAVWRLVFGASVMYLIALVVLLFMSAEQARFAMTLVDPTLNVRPVERSYATECTLNWGTFSKALSDRFVLAHFLGWVAKSLVIRNRFVCWFSSVTWELVEITFIHMLPNFAECWWDQVILDVLICNGLGIEIGFALCRHLEVQKYEWTGIRDHQTYIGKVKRMVMQFSPSSWMTVEWEFTKTWKRFLMLQLLLLAFQIKDLNAFFLKHVLYIPSEHPINIYRLLLIFASGLPTIRQVYIYMTDEKCMRLGSQAFVSTLIMLTEGLISIKFGQGMFPKPMPTHVKYLWSILFPLYLCGCAFILIKSKRKANQSCDAKVKSQ